MKILHLTSHLKIGGITRYILSLSKLLVQKRHTVAIASDHGSAESQLAEMGIAHWPFPFHTSAEFSPKVFFGAQRLIQRLKEEPVDLIHAHTRVGQVVAQLVTERLKIPYVTTWHGIYKPRLGRKLWPCMGELTIAISQPVCEQLVNDFHLPAKRIRRIYNGIDTVHYAAPPDPGVIQSYRNKWQLQPGQPVIGGIGRLASGKVKGFDSLLAATCLLRKSFPGIQTLIVGDGPRRPFLEDVARRLKIKDCVRFVGEMEDVRIPLALIDVFVFTSRWPEAFGLTLVEAMAARKPVVATSTGAVPEIIRHGVDGWLVATEDSISLSDGVARLLSQPDIAQGFAEHAHVRAREVFGVERMASEIEAVYREIKNRGNGQDLFSSESP